LLCRDLPPEFAIILEYIYGLDTSVEPDYKYIINLFLKVAEHEKIVLDNHFNWLDVATQQTSFDDNNQNY
jgi:hypothetical protein